MNGRYAILLGIMKKLGTYAGEKKRADSIDSNTAETMTVERLSENVSGVVHNVKSLLMAVNGYVDLLGVEGRSEIYTRTPSCRRRP